MLLSQSAHWVERLLRVGSAFRRRLLAVTLIKSIHASGGVNQFLFAGKKRVASGTDFHVQIALLGRTRLEGLAAGARNSDFRVFRVNSRFHLLSSLVALYRRPQGLKFKRAMIGGACEGRQADSLKCYVLPWVLYRLAPNRIRKRRQAVVLSRS